MGEVPVQSSRTITGRVVSNKMDKTAVVAVESQTAHPLYGKIIKRTTKYYIHDNDNVLNIGDLVRVKQSRPLSKLKRWVLEEVIEANIA